MAAEGNSAVEAAVERAAEARAGEIAAPIIEHAVEAANDATRQAEANAAAIAEAALETARGNRLAQLETDLNKCRNEITEVRTTLEPLVRAMQADLAELRAKVTTPIIAVAAPSNPENPSSSIQQPSPAAPEVIAEVIQPAAAALSAVADVPPEVAREAEKARRKIRLI